MTGVAVAAPRVPVPDAFGPAFLERLWFDDAWRQWNGCLLLALSGCGPHAEQVARMDLIGREVGNAIDDLRGPVDTLASTGGPAR